jgi:hypothetical protein
MTQLADLAKPFKGAYVETKPGPSKASYVEHNFVVERLLLHLGGYSFELVETFSGPFDWVTTKKDREGNIIERIDHHLDSCIQGVVCRLRVTLDGQECVIEEVGDVEHPGNWKTEGARLKVASSDALKRCAMRLGLGLHLWSGDLYFLDRALNRAAEGAVEEETT